MSRLSSNFTLPLKRMAGIKRGYVQSYLNEFVWRYTECSNRVDTFNRFIQLIKKFYPTEEGVVDSSTLIENGLLEEAGVNTVEESANGESDYDFKINSTFEEDDEVVENLVNDLGNIKINSDKKSVFQTMIKQSQKNKNLEIEKLGLEVAESTEPATTNSNEYLRELRPRIKKVNYSSGKQNQL